MTTDVTVGAAGDAARPLPARVTVSALVTVAVTGAVLLSPLGRTTFGRYFEGSTVTAAALVAAVAVCRQARRHTGAGRWAWSVLVIGLLVFAIGETWSTWLILSGRQNPSASPITFCYLMLTITGAAALVLHPLPGLGAGIGRRLTDATMVASSLAIVMWRKLLMQAELHHTRPDVVLSIAHPTSALVLFTVAALTIRRLREGGSWPLLTVGLVVVSVADAAFSRHVSTAAVHSPIVDLTYVVGLVIVAVAASVRYPVAPAAAEPAPLRLARTGLLTYLPIFAAVVILLGRAVAGQLPDVAQLGLGVLVMTALLSRQYLALREITVLSRALTEGEAQLRHQAFHDALTGLANRRLFHDRLEHALALHARDMRTVSVLFLDLDDFKVVNDTHGHVVGDELLVRIADRLMARTRVGDTVARLGGDEFAVLLEDGGDGAAVAAHILGVLARPVLIEGVSLTVTASLGMVSLDADVGPTTADQLMTRADTAMYAAKRSGKGRVELFRAGMSLSEVAEQQQADDLLAGIRTGAVTLVYQPVIDVTNGCVVGLEALARWNHRGEEIPPDVFVPLAERSGTIGALTDHVLEQACSQLATWTAATGRRRLKVGVNVPTQQLVTPGFVARIAAAIERHGLSRQQLILEITESELIDDTARARQVIDDLHGVGAEVSLDDFGVGYSSLSRLQQLQLDSVKVDKSFLDHIDDDPEQARFVAAILALGRSLGLPVIAEGIERATQLEELKRLGGTLVQGWYFAKGLPPEEVLDFVCSRAPAVPDAVSSA